MKDKRQAWIYLPWIDSLFILLPPFISLLAVFLFLPFFEEAEVSVVGWVVLVLLIDVAHVYTTLYRTYFDKETFNKHKSVLINIPLICWLAGAVVYEIDSMLFWRILAYMAVYHFVRQQYGFMRIYSRNEKYKKIFNYIDTFAIYYAAIYPIIYWHTHAPRSFHWFVEGDFYYFKQEYIYLLSFILYLLIAAVYVCKEIYIYIQYSAFNIPKNLIISGTFISWYFGIVYFNADLIFTTMNVISHGIPYMALVWIYGRKKYTKNENENLNILFSKIFTSYGIPLFLLIVFLLAYLEEGFWDGLIWKDHAEVFPLFSELPVIRDKHFLAFLVPLLSLPQVSHYVIDGFIWKISNDKFNWKKIVFKN